MPSPAEGVVNLVTGPVAKEKSSAQSGGPHEGSPSKLLNI